MIGTTFKEFYEQLYYGSDIEIVYKGENYIITSANCEDGRHNIYVYIYQEDVCSDFLYNEYTEDTEESINKFLNAKIFNNQSFMEIETDIEVISM